MKRADRKMFWTGVGELALAALCAVTLWRTGWNGKIAVLGTLVAAMGIGSVAGSFSREQARRARIEREDERNRLIQVKAKARAFDFLSAFLFAATAGCMIAYGVTRWQEFVLVCLGTGLPLGLSWLAHLAALWHYEKRE